MYKICLYL